jgi:flagellar basal-body rod protein FlgF
MVNSQNPPERCLTFAICQRKILEIERLSMGLLVSASEVIAYAQTRMAVAAQNMTNITTPGYKRQISFSTHIATQGQDVFEGHSPPTSSRLQTSTDFTSGKLMLTGNPTDLALTGPGFFVVRTSEGIGYQRAGSFNRDSNGHLVTSGGAVLQSAGGGDLVIEANAFTVLNDGVILGNGTAIGQIAVASIANPGHMTRSEDGVFSSPSGELAQIDRPSVRQGALEASNVVNGADMLTIMETMRRAEAGQKLVHTYDDMLGRVITSLGQM